MQKPFDPSAPRAKVAPNGANFFPVSSSSDVLHDEKLRLFGIELKQRMFTKIDGTTVLERCVVAAKDFKVFFCLLPSSSPNHVLSNIIKAGDTVLRNKPFVYSVKPEFHNTRYTPRRTSLLKPHV